MFAAAALYFVGINVMTFIAFRTDKRAAERGLRRTPESTLLTMAMIGGTPGAITGQQVLRHKTRKEPFRSLLWLIACAQLVALAFIAAQLAR
jgi:uncharacterized membrane protein YsdA (DUF1294 family)